MIERRASMKLQLAAIAALASCSEAPTELQDVASPSNTAQPTGRDASSTATPTTTAVSGTSAMDAAQSMLPPAPAKSQPAPVPGGSRAAAQSSSGGATAQPLDAGLPPTATTDASSNAAVDALTPEQLQTECGVAPAGLAPHFVTIPSSTTPDVQLSVAIQGDPANPPVVLLHGFPDFWCGWAPVIPELAKDYYVLAPDMRGYNRSSKPGNPDDPQDLAAYLLPELERDLADIVHYAAMQTQQKVSVVAHDWGAIVAWPFAHDYPEELSRLMAISVSHPRALSQFLASGDPALLSAQTQQTQALGYITELVMNDSPAQFSADGYKKLFDSLDQKHLHKPGAFPEVEREAYKRMWDADNQASFKSQIKYYRANFGVSAAGRAQTGDQLTPVPTAFIAPVYDGAILYPHSMDYLRENVAKEQPLLLRPIETGHFPQREEPAQLAKMIRQFLSVDW